MSILDKFSLFYMKLCRYLFVRLSDVFMEKQPTDFTCGQTCVAFIVGVSVDEVIAVMGKSGLTGGTDLKRALKAYNVPHGDRLVRITNKTQKPDYCIVKVLNNHAKEGHWIIFRNGKYHDPADGTILSKQEFGERYINWRETSYIEILEAF